MIKAVLAVERGELPPSLHYERANPRIDFETSPFYVNERLREWEGEGGVRRAGVSSFGIGGTNAHVVLEQWSEATRAATGAAESVTQVHTKKATTEAAAEAAATEAAAMTHAESVTTKTELTTESASESSEPVLLPLSARTPSALTRAAALLAEHLRQDTTTPLGDVSFTLRAGRRHFPERRAIVCASRAEAVALLDEAASAAAPAARRAGTRARRVAFLFSGQGAQYRGMGRGLYTQGGVFTTEMNRCFQLLGEEAGTELRDALYGETHDSESEAAAAQSLR